MATQKYRDDSHRLLAQARAELDAGELRQASEKGWGAAALIIKAIAEQRGDWEHSRHRHFATAAARPAVGNGQPRHSALFPIRRVPSHQLL